MGVGEQQSEKWWPKQLHNNPHKLEDMCEDTEGTFVLLYLLGSFMFHISKQVQVHLSLGGYARMKVPPFIASPLQCVNGLGSLC